MGSGLAHIKNWLLRATPDYYTMFIKAWIPLNAWYVNEYNTQEDRVAIDRLKGERNKIRNRIEALLTNEDIESKTFKFHLAQLHLQLEGRNIYHHDKKLTFTEVKLDQGETIAPATDVDKKGNVYKAAVGHGFFHVQIIRDKGKGKSLMDKKFTSYSIKSLLEDSQYIGLNDSGLQEKIRICYQKIDPENTVSLLLSNYYAKGDKMILDSDLRIAFIDNKELIAKSLIQNIYYLRCALFHGEIDPTETNQGIYEHTFYLLKSIIKELH